MASQYDFVPGFDLSSLNSATQEQVMQAIAQISPVSNIGGVIFGSTTPDVVNNPRFARYIWADTTDPTNIVFRKYDVVAGVGSWNLSGVANASIVAAMLANYAVSVFQNDNATSKISLRSDASADLTKALFVLRITSDGKYVEPVSMDAAYAGGGAIGLNRISVAGSGDYYLLGTLGGVLAYRVFDPANMINAGAIPASKLATSTPYFVLAFNAGGVATALQFDPTNMISPTGADADRVPLTKLQGLASGAATNDVIAFDGTNWVKKTPPLVNKTTSGDVALLQDTAIVPSAAHNLGATPCIIRAYLVSKANTAGTGYAVGDIIPIESVIAFTTVGPILTPWANATNYGLNCAIDSATYQIQKKDASAQVNVTRAQLIADWNARVVVML